MSDFYNADGKFVSMSTIEGFAIDIQNDTKLLEEIKELKIQIETGKLTKEQIITEVEKLNSLKANKDTSNIVKNAIESLVKNTVSKVDGIKLEGNMELSGIMKSKGFYLTDGTKVNEVTRIVNKLTVPLDKEGNLAIVPSKDKKVTINDLHVTSNTGLKVTGHGKTSSFGSLNSGWCHITTNAPNFHMNKKLTIEGGINTSGGRTHFRDVENKGRVRVGAAWGIPGFYSEDNQDIVVGVPRAKKVNLGTAGKFVEINGTGNIKVPGGAQVTGGRSHFKDVENKGRVRVGAAWGIPGFYSEDNQDIVVGVPRAKKVNLGTAGKFVEITGNGNMKVPSDINTPVLSRIGGDWLRINQQTNSVGRVATYGGFSINDTRSNHGGLSVGSWAPPGRGNITAVGQVKGKELLAEGNIKAVGQVKGKELLADSKICINNTCITEADLKKMIPVSYKFTNTTIKTAVNKWIANPAAATAEYGHIKYWDTSAVTDMTNLFQNRTTFNDDISNWDVSNVTSMFQMFRGARKFNQPIGKWDVSKVKNMHYMFLWTTVFNQPIGNWNVSNVTNMKEMFNGSRAFNQPIGKWNVSNVTNMNHMFYNAKAFNQDITGWNVKKGIDMHRMFFQATKMKARLASKYRKLSGSYMGGHGGPAIVKGGDYVYYGGHCMVLEKTGSFKLLKAKTPYQYHNMKPEWEFKSNRSPSENVTLSWDPNRRGGAFVIRYNGGIIWDAPRANCNKMRDIKNIALRLEGNVIWLANAGNGGVWQAKKGLPEGTGKSYPKC